MSKPFEVEIYLACETHQHWWIQILIDSLVLDGKFSSS